MRKSLTVALVAATTLALAACGSSDSGATNDDETSANEATTADEAEGGQDITLWLMGTDTPETLRDYLRKTYQETTGGWLTIEEQGWGDALSKLTTALPDAENTPDVTEIGNTWAATYANVGAFSDITDLVPELGGDSLLQSFVDVGTVDGANYAVPYYWGSRSIFYRKDVYEAAGVEVPTTLAEFTETAKKLKTDTQSGFYLGGEDWRNGLGWIFAYGGDLAVQGEDGQWTSTLSDEKTIEGLTALQDLYAGASLAPVTEKDSQPWININNNESTGAPEAATIIAPGWARWSIGDISENPDDPATPIITWNDDVFGNYALPGVDGGVAPVFAGGSNLAISAASPNQEGAAALLKIMFSEEYQTMLAESGMGPGNTEYSELLGDDNFAEVAIATAENSKLTPAAPGWAAVEGSGLLEEFFGKVNGGGDIAALAAEYDEKINPLLNQK